MDFDFLTINPMKENQLAKYQKYYSEAGLTDKLKRFAKKAGLKTVYATLLLYYVLLSKQVSVKEKTLIIGALGYLILPLDLIPDAIPLAGFTDDFTALLTAIHSIRVHITPEVEQQARLKLQTWFPSFDEKEIEEILK